MALGFIVVMAAGSDRPPPPGFLLVIVLGFGLGLAIDRLTPPLLDRWDRQGAGSVLLWVGGGGLVVAWAAWTVAWLFGGGEPGIRVGIAAVAIGYAVVGVVGLVGAVGVALVVRAIDLWATSRAASRDG